MNFLTRLLIAHALAADSGFTGFARALENIIREELNRKQS